MTISGRNDKCSCGSGKKYKHCCILSNKLNDGSYINIATGKNNLLKNLQIAIKCYNSGEIFEAEEVCRSIIQYDNNHQESLYLLGLIAYDKEEYDNAFYHINKVCKINKSNPFYQNLLGSIFFKKDNLDKAVICHNKAITLKPDFAEAFYNLGNDYNKQKNFQYAIECYKKSLSIKPNYSKAYYGLGIIYHKQSFYDISENCFRDAIKINPNYAEAYANLGITLQELGRLDEAEASYRQAIFLNPDYAEAYGNLGVTLQDFGRLAEAEASYRQAIMLNPDYTEAYANLGVTLQELGRLDEAERSCRQAIILNPDYAAAYSNLGVTLQSLGRLDEAESSYRQAISLKVDHALTIGNLLYCLNYMPGSSPLYYLEDAQKYGEIVTNKCSVKYSDWQANLYPVKLKVGFISGDLNLHPVGFFLEGVLKGIDKNKLELYVYSSSLKEDDLTSRIRPYFKEWRSIYKRKDEEVAKLIFDDALHLLVDLSGHTGNNRLPIFACKPAPIQVTWLGYFATTGVAEIDYLLGDPYVTPVNEEHHFTERIWRLPETYLCFTPPADKIEIHPSPSLAQGGVTFGCFNNLIKMNDSVVALWSKILNALPNSRLFLKTKQLDDKCIAEKTLKRFALHGITGDRLILEGHSPHAELLASYNRVDIALDPFPYPGGTTSVEALWMGVPVLTKCGDRFLSHVGESVAHNTSQSAWIANDDEDYVRKAIKFSSDLDHLAELRAGLRAQVLASPLFDAPRFAHHFEEAMWGMWNEWTSKRDGIQ